MQTDLSSISSSISLAGSSRAMPKSFLTGNVALPSFSTVAATVLQMVTSRSVAVSSSLPAEAESRTLDRMGRVVRVPTTFCTA